MLKYLASPRFTLPDVACVLGAIALLDAGYTWAAVGVSTLGAVALIYLDKYNG